MQEVVFDCEGDSLTPTKLHCLSANVNGKIGSATKYIDMARLMEREDVILIAHNCKRFDIPVIERLLDIKVRAKVVDTLALSWYLEPQRLRHGLEEWGEFFGVPKPEVEDWENLPLSVYIHRCEEDVRINTLLWERQWKQLLELYRSPEEAWRFIDYLMFKMDCAVDQEKHRWKLDVDKCITTRDMLVSIKEEKVDELKEAMPKVPVKRTKNKPAKMYKASGALSKRGEEWIELVGNSDVESIEIIAGYNEPNPNSHDQIKDWLYSLGWEPCTFKYLRDKETGEVRRIPQVQQDKQYGPGLSESVKNLYEKEPKLEVLDGLSILSHRISILNGFLENVDDEGYIQAKIQGLTNTLRFKHAVVVNLPGVDKPYGTEIRGCLTAPEGYELCGSDMSSLEDRTKQHYMFPYDPEYVKEMQAPGFDPHTNLAVFASEISAEDEDVFKKHKDDEEIPFELNAIIKEVKKVRKIYKSVNYAAVYGSGVATMARTAGCSQEKAKQLLDAYWRRNWSVRAVADAQQVKTCLGSMWLYNPVSKFWYSLRHDKDRFSTLNQGTGVYAFDTWLKHVKHNGPPVIGQMHDEWIALIQVGRRERMIKHVRSAMAQCNKELNLNRDLDCEIQFGSNYSEIH